MAPACLSPGRPGSTASTRLKRRVKTASPREGSGGRKVTKTATRRRAGTATETARRTATVKTRRMTKTRRRMTKTRRRMTRRSPHAGSATTGTTNRTPSPPNPRPCPSSRCRRARGAARGTWSPAKSPQSKRGRAPTMNATAQETARRPAKCPPAGWTTAPKTKATAQ